MSFIISLAYLILKKYHYKYVFLIIKRGYNKEQMSWKRMIHGKVTLVGQTTGGGSCIVLPCTTAAGAVFRISGSMQISIIQNGSFYNTDSGIVPHFFLDKPESFYDRPALAKYLRELK